MGFIILCTFIGSFLGFLCYVYRCLLVCGYRGVSLTRSTFSWKTALIIGRFDITLRTGVIRAHRQLHTSIYLLLRLPKLGVQFHPQTSQDISFGTYVYV